MSRSGSIQAVIFSGIAGKQPVVCNAADPPALVQGFYGVTIQGMNQALIGPTITTGMCKVTATTVLDELCGIGSGCYQILSLNAEPAQENVREMFRVSINTTPTLHFSSTINAGQIACDPVTDLNSRLAVLVEAIKDASPLAPLSAEFDALLDKAISCRSSQEPVEQWADRIAGEVSNLND
jgi:hypothetical protein